MLLLLRIALKRVRFMQNTLLILLLQAMRYAPAAAIQALELQHTSF